MRITWCSTLKKKGKMSMCFNSRWSINLKAHFPASWRLFEVEKKRKTLSALAFQTLNLYKFILTMCGIEMKLWGAREERKEFNFKPQMRYKKYPHVNKASKAAEKKSFFSFSPSISFFLSSPSTHDERKEMILEILDSMMLRVCAM